VTGLSPDPSRPHTCGPSCPCPRPTVNGWTRAGGQWEAAFGPITVTCLSQTTIPLIPTTALRVALREPEERVPLEQLDAWKYAREYATSGREPWKLAAELLAAYVTDHALCGAAEEDAFQLVREVLTESRGNS
jgi:hypothetical protein